MPDAPDDMQYSNVAEFTTTLDSGELAARLYSPTIYARAGQVLYMTDFTRGFAGLEVSIDEDNASLDLSTLYTASSGLSAKFSNSTEYDTNCSIGNKLPYVDSKYLILDLGYRFTGTSGVVIYEIGDVFEGTYYYIGIRHTCSPFKLELQTGSSTWEDITGNESSSSLFGTTFHLRIMFDRETGLFHSLMINSVPFTVSSIAPHKLTGAYTNSTRFYAGFYKSDGDTPYLYLKWIVLSLSDIEV